MAAHGVEQAHVVAIKQGVVQLNDKIDIADEEVVIPEQLDIIGPHRITILSKTFTPPKERKFKSFGTTFVDVLADPTLVVTAKPKDAATEIKIMGTFFNVTAVKFPLKCEGNIEVPKGGSGPGVIPELHWSAKMGAIVVVLTFDDGPHIAKITEGNRTDKVLNTLKKNSVQQETKAAFFVQTHVPFRGGSAFGQQLMKRENDEGHIVEVHTGSTEDHTAHTDRVKLPPYDVTNDGVPDGETALDSDLIRAKARILATTGHAAKYVRAPYGRTNAAVKKAYAREGLRHILWEIGRAHV